MTKAARNDDLRKQIRKWMTAHHCNQSQLAQMAGLNRSILTRFLVNAKLLSQESASKLYRVVTMNASAVERHVWLERFRLFDVAATLGLLPTGHIKTHIRESHSRNDLKKAIHLLDLSVGAGPKLLLAIDYLEQAESAFGSGSNMAAVTATNQVQAWLDLCDYPRARQEISRIEQAYSDAMDPLTHSRFMLLKGQLEYATRNFAVAAQILSELSQSAPENDIVVSAKHWLALTYMGMSESVVRKSDAKRWLSMAERYLRASLEERLTKYPVPLTVAFEHLRLSQIYRQQGRNADAQYHLGEARSVNASPRSRLHVDLEYADLALEHGDTSAARKIATNCLKSWSTLWVDKGYPAGMACALRLIALSLFDEGHMRQAIAPAITAKALVTNMCCPRGDRFATLPSQISSALRRQLSESAYQRLTTSLQQNLTKHAGYFAYLTLASPDRTSAGLQFLAEDFVE